MPSFGVIEMALQVRHADAWYLPLRSGDPGQRKSTVPTSTTLMHMLDFHHRRFGVDLHLGEVAGQSPGVVPTRGTLILGGCDQPEPAIAAARSV